MITFPSPITVPTAFHTFNNLPYVLMDDQTAKVVQIRIKQVPRPLVLWSGAAYDAIGDYTQAQVDARITELLGSDPAAVLTPLFNTPAPSRPTA
jgi:hypothetical protein